MGIKSTAVIQSAKDPDDGDQVIQTSRIISDSPIGNGLAPFHALFHSICDENQVPRTLDALRQLDQEDLQTIALILLSTLQSLPAAQQLASRTSSGALRNDILKLIFATISDSDDFDFNRVKPLLCAALAKDPDDALIWDQVYRAVIQSAMADRSRIISDNPIGNGLAPFHALFNLICDGKKVPRTLDALGQLDQKDLRTVLRTIVPPLLETLQSLPAAQQLASWTGSGALPNDIHKLISATVSDDFDFNCVKPLLCAALAKDPDDALIWEQVYRAVAESTPPPPPRPIPFPLLQATSRPNTASLVNSAEPRRKVNKVLRSELGPLYVGLPRFLETFFGRIPGLDAASKVVFEKCQHPSNQLFDSEGWRGWPPSAKEREVLAWFLDIFAKLDAIAQDDRPTLDAFAKDDRPTPTNRRRLLAEPTKPIQGSTGVRKLDVGLVDDPNAGKDSECHWSQILVPGELKSNRSADIASQAWLDLATYAREVFAAQDTRRFVLGFTLCGSFMRLWEFDRLGGIASKEFDINSNIDGWQFVHVILGFLWMSKEELGFDPTVIQDEGERIIDIKRSDPSDPSVVQTERLVIDELITRPRCIAGRATTCWKAHLKKDPQKTFVIKDSWQDTEHEEEGRLLQEATNKKVINVARYYHHEKVQIRGGEDDIRNNVRGGLDIKTATKYRLELPATKDRLELLMSLPSTIASGPSQGGCISNNSKKRLSSQTGAALPSSKRPSASSTKASGDALSSRVHQRVVVCDYGKPIHKASSRLAFLEAFEGCIKGHESLYEAGFLHRDISINNLMVNEDQNNPSWPSFLIDLDHAVRKPPEGSSGAKSKTGTPVFMAIGVLLGEQHSFMHDLESFFWVLFWVCIHYERPGQGRVVPRFDKWNYLYTDELAVAKTGLIADEGLFITTMHNNFTPYYQPLIPWVNRLRKEVFPNRGRWEKEDAKLYARMRKIFGEACKDPEVLAES